MSHRTRTVLWLLAMWALIALALRLTGCKTTPDVPQPPQVVTVTVTKYVPVPDALTADCQNEPAREQTYAEAKRLALVRADYLDECTSRMRKIRALK